MTISASSKLVRAIIVTGILTATAFSPAIARDGGGDGPRPSLHTGTNCPLQKKLEKAETNVTALQFEYRSLDADLKKAAKGSKDEAKLQRRIKKVEKKLSKERSKAASYYVEIKERQFNGIGC